MKIPKILITDYKKITLYGDMCAIEDGWISEYDGRCIRVKILGLFWMTYSYFRLRY
jgi:hypothetical protein